MVEVFMLFSLCDYHMSPKDIIRVNMFLISLPSLKQIHSVKLFRFYSQICRDLFCKFEFQIPTGHQLANF